MSVARLILCAGLLISVPAAAQVGPSTFRMTPAEPPAFRGSVRLGDPDARSKADTEEWFRQNGRLTVRNVSVASITPVLPSKRPTGAAVIVLPGGGFTSLAIDAEGFDVARRLADSGITSFVLKYRLLPTTGRLDDYQAAFNAAVRGLPTSLPRADDTPAEALADGQAALAFVRANAKRFGVDPARVGVVGFSAGGVLARSLGTAPGRKPAFVGAIYPRMAAVAVPTDAPPLFSVLAGDDLVVPHGPYGLVESWRSAGRPVEFHLVATGGHGFGVGTPGTSAEGWMTWFERWLTIQGLLGGK